MSTLFLQITLLMGKLFWELITDEVKSLVPKLGPTKKIIRLKKLWYVYQPCSYLYTWWKEIGTKYTM